MNEHAHTESWFNANKYPNITFKSLEIKKLNNGFSVLGELNMHGVKKALSFPFRYKQTDSGALFEGQFKVNRKDFGINGNAFGFMVGDLYTVDLAIPVKKKK
jgi:polyisoprenoid-binding protein YceI